jgi:starch phosphorylase
MEVHRASSSRCLRPVIRSGGFWGAVLTGFVTLHFGEVKVETRGEQHVFEVQVCLNDLDPKAVRVELYADGIRGRALVRQETKRVRTHEGASGGYVYSAVVSAARPPADYTARVIPHCAGVVIPVEEVRILWQR